jgi:RNA polymerase sigma factor (sigma-70 family)
MSTPQAATLLRHLRQLVAGRGDDPHSDRELLRRFAAQRDEAAFATLVRRHGPMVLGVCRRILRQAQDAEDAFQVTFLVLFRKAGSPFWRDSVGGWLHRVAARIALRLRARGSVVPPVGPAEEGSVTDPLEQLTVRELLVAFEEELAHLPESYREPLVLCHREGKTQEEVARQLGRSLSTIRRRLERGKKLLHQRLTRRGLELPAALGAVLLSGEASAAVPVPLGMALTQALNGNVQARVAVLTQGALHAMSTAKLKAVVALVLVLGMFAVGAGWAAHGALAGKPAEPRPAAQAPRVEADRPAAPRGEAAPPAHKDFFGDPLPPGVVARMGSSQLRHFRAHVTFAADGKTLISAGPDARVCAWDVATGRLIRGERVRRPVGHGFLYWKNATISPDGKLLAINDVEANAVYLHDSGTGEERGRIPFGGPMDVHIRFSLDGKTLAFWLAPSNKSLRLWDISGGKERGILNHPSPIDGFAFSPDDTLLASSCRDGLIRLWDVSTGRELRNGRGEGGSLAFSPDGKTLAGCTSLATVTLWETATLTKQATLKSSPSATRTYQERGLAFSPDGTLLAVGEDTALILWDVPGRKERRRLLNRYAHDVAFTPDGKTLACAGEVEIRLWDVATGRQLHQRPGHDDRVATIAVSPDGKVMASTSWNRSLHLWDAASGKPLDWRPSGPSRGIGTTFSPDGKWFLYGDDGAVQIWEIATGKEGRRFDIEDVRGAKGRHEVWEVALSPDGRRLAALSLGDENLHQLSVWDAATGRSIARRPHQGHTLSFSPNLSPDGAAVIVETIEPGVLGGTLTLEDTVTGQRLLTIPRKVGYPLSLSPDDKLLAAGIHRSTGYQVKGISVTEMTTGEEVLSLDGPFAPVVFSPDGRLLATIDAVGDGGLRVWDVATGQLLFRRAWPADAVRHPGWSPAESLTFLPGGRTLATGMVDGTVLVWDLAPETWPKTGLAEHLDRKQLDAAWSALAGDARKAHRAIYTLAAVGEQALPLLTEHLRPAPAVEAKRVEKLLAELDSEQFQVREAAARELSDMGLQIEPALQRVLDSKPSLEVRNRVRAIQETLRRVPPTAVLRTLRAIRVLEMIGTAEARQMLRHLAGGAAGARETRDAADALARQERRSSASP